MDTHSPRKSKVSWTYLHALIALTLCAPLSGISQQDTSFWFVAPRTWSYHSPTPTIFKLASGPAAETNVTITRPADQGNGWSDISLTLGPNDIAHIEIPSSLLFPIDTLDRTNVSDTVPDQVTAYGIHIQSDEIITGYYENSYGQTNPDIFALKGRNALGTEFVTPFQDQWNNVPFDQWEVANEGPKSGFDIVATEDNTEIYVVATAPVVRRTGGVYTTGDTIRFTLNLGQTYRVKAASRFNYKHLGGSIIRSTKPIAVTTWDDSVLANDCGDLIGDQMVPASSVGQEYIVMSGFTNADGRDDQIIVQPIEPNTTISITNQWGWPETQVHSRTNPWSYNHTTSAAYVTADKPVYVFHIAGNGCELGGAYLPPVDNCTGSKEVGFVRSPAGNPDYSINKFILNLAVRTGHENNFSFSGFNPGFELDPFTPVPGSNGDWMYIRQEFDTSLVPVDANLRISNNTGLFHLGVINGEESDGGTKYGYFSSFANLDLGSPEVLCAGSEVDLDAGETAVSYLWSTGETTQIITVQAGDTYAVSATFQNGCVGVDEVAFAAQDGPSIDLGADFALCFDAAQLDASSDAIAYRWSTGAVTPAVTIQSAGLYSITATAANSCTTVDSITVAPNTNPSLALVDRNICNGANTDVDAGYQWTEYQWSTGAQTPLINVSTAGRYAVTVTDTAGCQTSAAMNLAFFEELPINMLNQGVCVGDSTTVNPGSSSHYNYLWSTGATTEEITIQTAGYYYVTVTDDNSCSGTGGMRLFVRPLPDLELLDGQFCSDGTYTARGIETTAATYRWSNGADTETAIFATVGTHSLTITDGNGCQNSDQMELTHFENPTPVLQDALTCQGDDYEAIAPDYAGYHWSGGGSTKTKSFNLAGTYGLTVTDQNGCHGATTFDLGYYTDPVLNLPNGTVCAGDTFSVDAQPFVSYAWHDGQSTPTRDLTTAGTYTVTVTDQNGCTTTSATTLSLWALPTPEISPVDQCAKAGTTVALSQSYSSYLWNTGASTAYETALQDDVFSVTVTDINGCQNSTTSDVNLFGVPKLSGSIANTATCLGGSIEMIVNVEDPDNNGPYDLILVIDDQDVLYPDLVQGQNILTILSTVSTTIQATTLTSSRGCRLDATELALEIPSIVINDLLEIESTVTGNDCPTGESGAEITVELIKGEAPWKLTYEYEGQLYDITNIENPFYSIPMAAEGAYTLRSAIDANGCYPVSGTLPATVEVVKESPTIQDTRIALSPSCYGVRVEVEAYGDQIEQITWNVADRSSNDNPAQFHVGYNQTLAIDVMAASEFCAQTYSTTQTLGDWEQQLEISPQNVFSPNADGVNDFFEMDPENFYSDCAVLQIFNRWGTLIYEGEIGDSSWDGDGFKGNAPQGTYYVIYHIGDLGQINRSLTLMR